MINLIKYELYESENLENLNQEQMDFLNKYATGWKFNEETRLVDCDSFSCDNEGISDFRGIRFGICKFAFSCSQNNLISLKGCPKEIGQSFYVSDNKLTTLEHCSEKVGFDFSCFNNNLTTLEHCPKEIGLDFSCSNNKLTTLEHCPEKVGIRFYCTGNELKSLESLFNSKLIINETNGYIISDFGAITHELFELIKNEMNKGISYKESILKLWAEFSDEEKKIFIMDLPKDGLGKVIRNANKFGMNI